MKSMEKKHLLSNDWRLEKMQRQGITLELEILIFCIYQINYKVFYRKILEISPG